MLLVGSLTACGSTAPSGQGSESVVVFAAASLKQVFTQIGERFKADNPGVNVEFSFAGSSELANNLTQGATADVFASADTAQMNTVAKAGLLAADPTNFAANTLVIVTAPGNPKNIASFADLARPGLSAVVCQQPVPCGSATRRIEDATGIQLHPVSEEPSVSDALNKVTTGQADAALVYVTDARTAGSEGGDRQVPRVRRRGECLSDRGAEEGAPIRAGTEIRGHGDHRAGSARSWTRPASPGPDPRVHTPTDLPRWVYLPAAAGTVFVGLPLVAIAVKVDWPHFWSLISSDSSATALLLSLKTAAASTALCVLLGVPMALVLARSRLRLVRWLRPVILLPLVLPPVVGGIALLYAFGRLGLIGRYLEAAGVSIAFSTTAVVLAETFVSLPFLVISLEGAARSAGADYEVVAATLGARPSTIWWRVTLPLLLPGLVSGAVLAFARALGEFGATLTFAGSLQGVTRTLPLEIYLQRVSDPDAAVALSLLLVAVAALVVLGLGARRLTGTDAR